MIDYQWLSYNYNDGEAQKDQGSRRDKGGVISLDSHIISFGSVLLPNDLSRTKQQENKGILNTNANVYF